MNARMYGDHSSLIHSHRLNHGGDLVELNSLRLYVEYMSALIPRNEEGGVVGTSLSKEPIVNGA